MKTPSWHFNVQQPCDKARDSVSDEFFSTEGIRDTAEAIVREGIQNSLDASDGTRVTVSICLSGSEKAVTPSSVTPYLVGAWEHFEAPASGLRELPSRPEKCPFLVFEDFGTTGLTGDIGQYLPPDPGKKNAFYHFFRAEGRSDKSEGDRGRWGIGKHVFMRASRVRSIFGLSTRADDNATVLMGICVLKSHRISGTYFQPDGWYGLREKDDSPEMPVDNAGLLDNFAKTFRLQRKPKQSGLSIVVPWYDPDLDEQKLVEAAARDYFYPILRDKLEVVVDAPGVQTILSADSLISEVSQQPFASELHPLLSLGAWALKQTSETLFQIHTGPKNLAPRWSHELLAEDKLKAASSSLNSGQNLGFRVPVTVYEKGRQPSDSYFDVYLSPDSNYDSGVPVFLREGINVSDIRAPRTRGYRSLIIVEDKGLATMLGDSENPAHTQWQKDGSNFRGKYDRGPSILRFVISSASELLKMLVRTETAEDRNLLADVFSVASPPEIEEKVKAEKEKRKPGVEPPLGPPPIPPPAPQSLRGTQVDDGFSVARGNAAAADPLLVDIQVAYSVRRGNPLHKYERFDFELDKDPIKVTAEGVDLRTCDGNRIVAMVQQPDFSIRVTGFDPNRDLYVRARAKEQPADGDQAV